MAPTTNPPPRVTELEAYYHALYHLVTHWAAYVAMIALLLTIALLLCLTPIAGDAHGRIIIMAAITAVSAAGCMYFVLSMKMYGDEVNARLPPAYKARVPRLNHPHLPIKLGITAPVVLAVFDILFLCSLWR
jgi:hypothetical protein